MEVEACSGIIAAVGLAVDLQTNFTEFLLLRQFLPTQFAIVLCF
jgi:hypothetical protein